jgi:hypothetical protein
VSGRQVAEIGRSRELGVRKVRTQALGTPSHEEARARSSESAIRSYRRFGASGIGSWKSEGLASRVAKLR